MLLLAAGLPAADRDPAAGEIEQIIQKFAANESAFAQARASYTYRQTARVQELDEGGNVRGRFEIIADILFSPDGKRGEKIVRAPVTTLVNIQLTPEDEQDLRDVQPFVLTTAEVPNYYVRYLGRETLDEIACYAFAVKPKRLEAGKRYLQGIIWVDDRDLMIVKSYGRGTGLKKKGVDYQYPKFETFREQIDGKYWFPTYTIANSVLPFENGPQRIRQSVRYEDYKQFKADVKVIFGDPVKTPESKETKKP